MAVSGVSTDQMYQLTYSAQEISRPRLSLDVLLILMTGISEEPFSSPRRSGLLSLWQSCKTLYTLGLPLLLKTLDLRNTKQLRQAHRFMMHDPLYFRYINSLTCTLTTMAGDDGACFMDVLTRAVYMKHLALDIRHMDDTVASQFVPYFRLCLASHPSVQSLSLRGGHGGKYDTDLLEYLPASLSRLHLHLTYTDSNSIDDDIDRALMRLSSATVFPETVSVEVHAEPPRASRKAHLEPLDLNPDFATATEPPDKTVFLPLVSSYSCQSSIGHAKLALERCPGLKELRIIPQDPLTCPLAYFMDAFIPHPDPTQRADISQLLTGPSALDVVRGRIPDLYLLGLVCRVRRVEVDVLSRDELAPHLMRALRDVLVDARPSSVQVRLGCAAARGLDGDHEMRRALSAVDGSLEELEFVLSMRDVYGARPLEQAAHGIMFVVSACLGTCWQNADLLRTLVVLPTPAARYRVSL